MDLNDECIYYAFYFIFPACLSHKESDPFKEMSNI